MKLLVTLDYFDGSQSKAREVDAEEFPVREMMWHLMASDVCGFTVTCKSSLKKIIDKMDEQDGGL